MSEAKQFTIIVVRHGEKDKEGNLTAEGARQMFDTALRLNARGLKPEIFGSSPALRAMQGISIMAAAYESFVDGTRDIYEEFLFEETLKAVFGTNRQACLDQVAEYKQYGVTLSAALERSEYARRAKIKVSDGLHKVARELYDSSLSTALVVSHSPYLECAAADPAAIPYGLNEADAIIYTVEGDFENGDSPSLKVLSSEYFPSPLGKSKNLVATPART